MATETQQTPHPPAKRPLNPLASAYIPPVHQPEINMSDTTSIKAESDNGVEIPSSPSDSQVGMKRSQASEGDLSDREELVTEKEELAFKKAESVSNKEKVATPEKVSIATEKEFAFGKSGSVVGKEALVAGDNEVEVDPQVVFGEFTVNEDDEFAKQNALLEIITLKKQGTDIVEKMKDMKALVSAMEVQAHEARDIILTAETRLFQTKLDLEKSEKNLKYLEETCRQLTDKADASNNIEDKLQASTQAMKVLHAQVPAQQLRHNTLELESKLQQLHQDAKSLRQQLETQRTILADLELEAQHTTKEFLKKQKALGLIDGRADVHTQNQVLNQQNEVLITQVAELHQEIETLKSNVVSFRPLMAPRGIGPQDNLYAVHGADVETSDILLQLQKQKNELAAENAKLKVIFELYLAVRNRKFEFEQRGGKPRNSKIIDHGDKFTKFAACVGDAILFTSAENHRDQDEYTQAYLVNPNTVLEHPSFTMFHDVVDFRCDLFKNGVLNGNTAFLAAFQELFDAIHPNFTITTDEEITNNQELMDAYTTLKGEHDKFLAAQKPGANKIRSSNDRGGGHRGRGGFFRGDGRNYGGNLRSGSAVHTGAGNEYGDSGTTGGRLASSGDIRLQDGTAGWVTNSPDIGSSQ